MSLPEQRGRGGGDLPWKWSCGSLNIPSERAISANYRAGGTSRPGLGALCADPSPPQRGGGKPGMLLHGSSTAGTGGKRAGNHPPGPQPPTEVVLVLSFQDFLSPPKGLSGRWAWGWAAGRILQSLASSPGPVEDREHRDTCPAVLAEPGSDPNFIPSSARRPWERERDRQSAAAVGAALSVGQGDVGRLSRQSQGCKLSCCCKSSAAGPGEQLRQALAMSRN